MDLTTLAAEQSALNSGDTAWLLISSALVLLMTPGLAFFYGGMVRGKSVLNMMMMSFVSIGIVSILWALFGYSLAFGGDEHGGLIGGLEAVGMGNILTTPDDSTYPPMVFAAFQLMFAIITVALISGAIADRVKFGSWVLFSILWASVVYFPVANWVFNFGTENSNGEGGWIATSLGAIDYAGGTAVHINAGVAALVLALVVGRREGFKKDPMRPHNLPLVLLGAGLLWFGWFGFNAGSAIAANNAAAVVFMNTQLATAAAALAWIGMERLRQGHATTLGLASGAVAGLVAITPACSAVTPLGAIVVGLIAGGLCSMTVHLKFRANLDDSLDVVGIHLVGGIVGSLIVGLLASAAAPAGIDGLFYGGGLTQMWKQLVAVGAVMAYTAVMTFIIAMGIKHTMGWRVSRDDELQGIDSTAHAETAYDFSMFGGGSLSGTGVGGGAPVQRRPTDTGKVGA